MTADEFVTGLSSAVPEAEMTVRDHLEGQEGELLLHLLVADLRRLAIDWFAEGYNEPLQRLLGVVEAALRLGDDYVTNAIAVSFVEDLGWWASEMQPFIATLPHGLVDEIERQRRPS